MDVEERNLIRLMVDATITRLKATSTSANHMGHRYSRLLELLWQRTTPTKREPRDILSHTPDARLQIPQPVSATEMLPEPPLDYSNMMSGVDGSNASITFTNGSGNGQFSWLDLGATWQFAMNNMHVDEQTVEGGYYNNETMGQGYENRLVGGDLRSYDDGAGLPF
jgi:hypothetical protein